MITLVPEKRQELTTEGGLDVAGNIDRISAVVSRMREKGVAVSLFIDADKAQVKAAAATRADMIEIHTGHFSDAPAGKLKQGELARVIAAARMGKEAGMGVNAGHGLDYDNVGAVAAIPYIDELSIGHSIVARAVFAGLDRAVRDMIALVRGPFTQSRSLA